MFRSKEKSGRIYYIEKYIYHCVLRRKLCVDYLQDSLYTHPSVRDIQGGGTPLFRIVNKMLES